MSDSQAETTDQFERLARHLDDCRRQHKTVTYLEAADAIDIQPPQRIHQLTEVLEALMEHDHKHHHPLRAALVVSRGRSGLPAEGFFLKAQSLNLMPAVTAEEFHQTCLERLFDEETPARNIQMDGENSHRTS
jgi:hypothetical protein